MKKICFSVLILMFAVWWCFAQDNFARGEDLFMQNRPREATVFFEHTIAADPTHILAHMYLGIAYEQLDRLDEAITVYQQVLGRAGDMTANIASNLANVYFKRGSYTEA